MTTTLDILKWLDAPYPLSDMEMVALESLTKKYPWYRAAHFVLAVMNKYKYPDNYTFRHPIFEFNPVIFSVYVHKLQAETTSEQALDIIKEDHATQENDMPIVKPSIATNDKPLIEPLSANDYFATTGMTVEDDLPSLERSKPTTVNQPIGQTSPTKEEPGDLMVVRTFSDWLKYFKVAKENEKEEEESKKALKAMWQREKLSAALEDEEEEIPEEVFSMAVNSITQDESLISESYADILLKQGKTEKAIEVYKKLSLRNPDKSGYFAAKIEDIYNQ